MVENSNRQDALKHAILTEYEAPDPQGKRAIKKKKTAWKLPINPATSKAFTVTNSEFQLESWKDKPSTGSEVIYEITGRLAWAKNKVIIGGTECETLDFFMVYEFPLASPPLHTDNDSVPEAAEDEFTKAFMAQLAFEQGGH